MKRTLKFSAVVLAVVMIITAFAGCGNKSGSSSDAIKIGGIGPTTGGAAIYGNAVKNAAEIAVEEINAKGDLKFEFKFQDDEHDAEKSVNAYNALKDWGMQILMGTVTTGPCIAVSAKTNEDNIFQLTPSASSTDVIGGQPDTSGNVSIARKSNVFQMCFTDPNQGSASAEYISEQKLGTKIGIIYNSADAYSTGIYQKFKSEAQKLKLEIVAEEAFTSDDTTDFKTQVAACKNANADLIFLPIYYTPASQILIEAKNVGYSPKFFGVDGMDGILTLKNFDTSLAEGVMLLTPFAADAQDEKTQSFVKKYKEKFGDTPNQFAADAYDCIYALYEACKKAGVTSGMSASDISDKLQEVFNGDFSFTGLTSDSAITWSDTGEVSKAPKAVVIKDGAYIGM